jgi:hypothetical protein
MPSGYGGYAPHVPTGSDSVPIHGYYPQGAHAQPVEEEPVYYAQPIADDEPVVEIAAHTSQLSARPKPATGRPSVTGRQTAGMRPGATGQIKGTTSLKGAGSSTSAIKRNDRGEESSGSGKRVMLILGALVLAAAAGWFIFGRDKRSDSGGSAGGLLADGPPPVSFELPEDRIFPPASDDIPLHLVAGTGSTASRKNADGKSAVAALNEIVTEWHDLAPLGNDNFLRSTSTSSSHSPKRAFFRAAAANTAGIRGSRAALDFRARDGKPTALNLTDLEGQSGTFPFGSAAPKGEKGLTLALMFQVDAAKLPTRVLTLSGEGDVSLSLTVDAQKNINAEFKNGALVEKVASKDVDPAEGVIAFITWSAGTGATELRVRDSKGKTFQAPGPKVTAPAEPLSHLQIGRVENSDGQPAPLADQFSGLAGEIILYSSVLKTDQIQLLDRSLRDHYFQVPTAAPKAPAAKAPASPAAAKK